MELFRALLVVYITMIVCTHNWRNAEGRYHNHHPKKQKNPVHNPSPPSKSPSTPSKPQPDDPSPSTSGSIFDVTSFGAVGDGANDDTAAFIAAWKAACAVDSGVVLAPENYRFKITSTIFSGPCKPGLVFQVSFSSYNIALQFVEFDKKRSNVENVNRWMVC